MLQKGKSRYSRYSPTLWPILSLSDGVAKLSRRKLSTYRSKLVKYRANLKIVFGRLESNAVFVTLVIWSPIRLFINQANIINGQPLIRNHQTQDFEIPEFAFMLEYGHTNHLWAFLKLFLIFWKIFFFRGNYRISPICPVIPQFSDWTSCA